MTKPEGDAPPPPIRPTGIKARFAASLHHAYDRFVKIRGAPREIALGLALGLFVGMSPTMGIQMPIAIFLAALVGWSKISAAMGVWISNPLSAPLLYGVTYYVGAKVLSMPPRVLIHGLNFEGLKSMILHAPEILWAMTVGGVILGIPISVAGYWISHTLLIRYRKEIESAIQKEKALIARTREKLRRNLQNRKIRKRGRTLTRRKPHRR